MYNVIYGGPPLYAKSSMWKNNIKLQKFYPHEYRFSNIIAFSSLRPSRERPEIFTQRQKHFQTDVIEWITHNYYWLITKTRQNMVGSQFVAAQSGESICRQISFLNDFENQSFFLGYKFWFFLKLFSFIYSTEIFRFRRSSVSFEQYLRTRSPTYNEGQQRSW